MSDLISRQPLLQEIEDNTIEGYIQMSQSEIANMIANAPSAEKIGTWKNITLYPYDITGQAVGECSLCGKQRIVDNYCSNCGARMVNDNE